MRILNPLVRPGRAGSGSACRPSCWRRSSPLRRCWSWSARSGCRACARSIERTEELIKLQRKIEAYRQVQHDTTSQLYSVASALVSSDERTLDSTLRQLNQFGYDVDRLEFVAKDEVELLEQFRRDYDRFVAVVTQVVELIRGGRTAEARDDSAATGQPRSPIGSSG